MSSITLLINNLSLEISKFLSPQIPRARIKPQPTLEYSIYGAPIGTGPIFNPKFHWTINAILTSEQVSTLEAIYAEFIYQAKNGANGILIEDRIHPIIEKTPQTRSAINGTSTTTINGGYIKYYAKYYAWIIESPTYEKAGINFNTTFQLQETNKI